MTKDGTMLENDVTADKRRHECLTDSTTAETATWLPLETAQCLIRSMSADGVTADKRRHECEADNTDSRLLNRQNTTQRGANHGITEVTGKKNLCLKHAK
eukprot:scaffold75535_cov35-Cyclotella_meneghiniana.AAC.2